MKNPTPLFLFLLSSVILFSLTGCIHYKLGYAQAPPLKTLYVSVENNSYAPQAQALLKQNLINAFLRDGQIRIVEKEKADAIVSVILTEYNRELSATQVTDTALARAFSLNLKAEISLHDNRNEKTYFKRILSTRESIFAEIDTGSDLPQAEYQTMPVLTYHLAQKIKDAVVTVW
jgi:hypothetical protein